MSKRKQQFTRGFLLIVTVLLISSLSLFALADVGQTYGTSSDTKNGVARVYVEGTYTMSMGGSLLHTGSWAGTGSAFAIGKENEPVSYFVTNRHVVSPGEKMVEYDNSNNEIITEYKPATVLYLLIDNSHTLLPFDIISTNDGGADLALIKLRDPTTERKPCYLYPKTDLSQLTNIPVYSVGYPAAADKSFSVDDLLAGIDSSIVNAGTVTGKRDAGVSAVGGEVILMDATINPGNSGGPLVDDKGGVLGVCTFSALDNGARVEGMHAAVSINELRRFLDNQDVPYETVKKPGISWIVYVIIGAAIIGVIILLAVLVRRKPTPKPTPKPAPVPPASPKQSRVLICVKGPMKDRRYELKENGKLLIGRSKDCQIRFADGTPGVSSVHCQISFDGKSATIKDLGSTHGTFVDHKKLAPNVPTVLHRSLAVGIGSDDILFVLQ